MVFELDTKDMERHSVELRLYLEKASRRFEKAKMRDTYETIVKNQLPETDLASPNVLQIDQLSSAEETRRLSTFLARLIETCDRTEHHELLQSALRESLYQSRRKSISIGSQPEPFCFFCASGVCPPENPFGVDGLANHQGATINGNLEQHYPALELVVARQPLDDHNHQQQSSRAPAPIPAAAATTRVPGNDDRQQAQVFFNQYYDGPSLTPPPEMRSSTPSALATPVSIPSTTPPLDGQVQDLSTRKGSLLGQSNKLNGIKRKLQMNEQIEEDEHIDVQTNDDDDNTLLPANSDTTSFMTAGEAFRHLAQTTSQLANGTSPDSGANSQNTATDDDDDDETRSVGPLAIDEDGNLDAAATNLNSSGNEESRPSSGEPAPFRTVGYEVKRLKIEMVEDETHQQHQLRQQIIGGSQRNYSQQNGLKSNSNRRNASSQVFANNANSNRRSSYPRRGRPLSSKSLTIKKPHLNNQ